MTKEAALTIIKSVFHHLFYEEDLKVGNVHVLLYFPTMGIAIVDTDDAKRKILDQVDVEDIDSLMIKKELAAKTIYLDLEEEEFNIGFVINDILVAINFEPPETSLMNRDGQM